MQKWVIIWLTAAQCVLLILQMWYSIIAECLKLISTLRNATKVGIPKLFGEWIAVNMFLSFYHGITFLRIGSEISSFYRKCFSFCGGGGGRRFYDTKDQEFFSYSWPDYPRQIKWLKNSKKNALPFRVVHRNSANMWAWILLSNS